MELVKIGVKSQRLKIMTVLECEHARHNQRIWMTGFLRYVGYSAQEICEIIKNHNQWVDYNESYTQFQIESVFQTLETKTEKHPSKQSLHAPQRVEDLIFDFLKNTQPHNFVISSNILDAVACYYQNGFTPLPKSKTEKRPAFEWREYQNRRPCLNELLDWDWSNGICLLANDEYSFLDIDLPGYEFLFNGRHIEKTPRGGLHVFGKGKMKSVNINGAEIKGIGTLIVAAPTHGYQVLNNSSSI